MGIDAYVQCNCIKKGKVKPAPFDMNLIEVTEGVYDIKEEVSDEIYYQYQDWAKTACEHPHFEYYENRIGNGWGLSTLWGVIEKVGEENVPEICLLFKDKKLPFDQVERALQQVELLKKELKNVYGIFLLEVGTNKCFGDIIDDQKRWFYSHGGAFYYGLSNEGFYMEDKVGKEVFKSMDFMQDVVTIQKGDQVIYEVTFTDVATGKTYLSSKPIERMDWYTKTYYFPKALFVLKRTLTIEDVSAIKVLEELFRAALEMENPVVIA